MLFIKQTGQSEVASIPFILLSTSKDDGAKSSPVTLITSCQLATGTMKILGREIRLIIWDGNINFLLFWPKNIPSSPIILWYHGIFYLMILAENLLIFYKKSSCIYSFSELVSFHLFDGAPSNSQAWAWDSRTNFPECHQLGWRPSVVAPGNSQLVRGEAKGKEKPRKMKERRSLSSWIFSKDH